MHYNIDSGKLQWLILYVLFIQRGIVSGDLMTLLKTIQWQIGTFHKVASIHTLMLRIQNRLTGVLALFSTVM